ncbi:MAG: alpha/beta hydrolase [Chloroflexi bacterium]|nr:alpha/beta hydrolase [Chloroflexota bacterium]MCI0580826.1 alpha/beta hydrolase [Chloroflexota bacterium]MCI0648180.1 alpha/beta hydrolase [Chloroflexota bacterium]MCI0730322.1 alpha/beta hydrolase [Chloroflexota bacterium]
MTSTFAEVNGTKLHYQAVGAGRPVVFIHAGIGHLAMWDDQIGPLASRYRVIRYDVRGWGKSASPSGSYADHDDLHALLERLGETRAALVGCSFGGKIAVDFALAYPEMVSALVLVGAALSGYQFTDEETEQKDQALEEAYARGDKALAAELCAQIWADGPTRRPEEVDTVFRERALVMIRETFELPEGAGQRRELEPRATGRLAEIAAPTLIVLGEHDTPDIATVAGLLERGIAGARKVMMAGTAHLPSMEKPAELNHILLAFLETVL